MSLPAFPIPVVAALGPGSQPDDEAPAVLPMPRDMATWQPPVLPEPEIFAGRGGAVAALRAAHAELGRLLDGEPARPVVLDGLDDADRRLIHQVLGEGEVAAQVDSADGAVGTDGMRAQESVFAGVWRVLRPTDAGGARDTIEVGAIPAAVRVAAAADGGAGLRADPPAPADLMNGPAILSELADAQRRWQPGQAQHVVNLTLLPLTPGDSEWLQARIGEGRVRVLSRGYGNCRISNTRLPHCWRVVYYNSMDKVILNTVEVVDMPEVAMAAPEDLRDSHERLSDVLGYLEQS